MKKLLFFVFLMLLACNKEKIAEDKEPTKINYDIVLIAGQSNTCSGIGYNPLLDAPYAEIKQLGRWGSRDFKIVTAREPLEHHTITLFRIGFALSFAKEYARRYLKTDRELLLIPCGHGGTGFHNKNWNKGDSLYDDAIKRTAYVLSLNKENRLVGILWHQGEDDIGWPNYQNALDTMISNMRKDLVGHQNIPFILGGMVPYYVNLNDQENRKKQQNIIANTPNRVLNTAYVSPYYPFVLEKKDNDFDVIHFDAPQQRILGKRYFNVFDSLIKAKTRWEI